MRLLLDTHILLWTAQNSPRLSSKARDLIEDRQNSIFFSVVSLWEIVIKSNLRRPSFEVNVTQLRDLLLENGFFELQFESSHVLGISKLVARHRDPFDHAIISQALVEHLTLLTSDSVVAHYNSSIIKV